MESKNRGTQPQHASGPILQSSDFSPSTVGFMGSEFGRSHVIPFQDYHQNPRPLPHLHPYARPFTSPQSYEIQEAIQREIEKSKIRDQVIIDEIVRRRMIESEVRRELMQRELALRQGINNALPFSLPPAMGFDLPVGLSAIGSMAEGRSLDERDMLPCSERDRSNGSCDSGWKDTLPFQRGTINPRVSEVKSVSEGGKEKERIILLPKPDEVSGLKRKAVMPSPATDAGENSSEDMLRKRAKEEWSCALCQVSATSERGLNDHLEGKKHKAKEAKLKAKAGKKYLGMSIKVEGPLSPCTQDGLKSTSGSLLSQKAGVASSETNDQGLLQKNTFSDSASGNHPAVTQTVQKRDDPKKGRLKFWCEICQVGAHTMKVMDDHKNGRKHLFRLQKSNQNSGADTSDQNEKMTHENVAEENKSIASDNVGEAFEESALGDHVATDLAKPEDHEAIDESETKGCGVSEESALADHVATDSVKPEDLEAIDESETKGCGVDDDVSTKPDV